MRNKCKICGYRFKNRDEVICPECFTAREEDISCSGFSSDLHSHSEYSSNNSGDYSAFSVNDTFKESNNSFIEEERKEERLDKFARAEDKEAQSVQQNFIPQQDGIPFIANQQTAFNRQTVNQFQRTPNGYTVKAYNAKPNKPKKKNGCGCTIMVLVFLTFTFSIINSAMKDKNEKENKYEKQAEIYNDNNETRKIVGYSYETETEKGSYGDYKINLESYSVYRTEETELSDSEFETLSYYINESSEVWDSINLYFTVENSEDEPIEIEHITCYGYDGSKETISISNYDSFDLPITVEDETTVAATLLCSPDAEYTYVEIGVSVNYDSDVIQFEINKE